MKRISLYVIIFGLFICFVAPVFGQQITAANPNVTPKQAVENVLLGGGVSAFNIKYNGSTALANNLQNPVKKFLYGGSVFPLSEGVLLTSTSASTVTGDPDLFSIANYGNPAGNKTPTNGVIIEFDFIPTGDTLSFSYVFTSSEYTSYTCSSFNDVFGFFISGPGISGPYSNNSKNIAIVPNSNNIPVGINTVNSGNAGFNSPSNCSQADPNWQANSIYFTTGYNSVYNMSSSPFSGYNGSTKELIAGVKVICGQVYHIKLAISNVTDTALDSGVFLKAGSFVSASTVDINVSNLTSTIMDTVLVEGCDQGQVCFSRAITDATDELVTHFQLSGTATQGLDYAQLSPGDSIVFAPGQTEICLPIIPYDDGIHEGLEQLIISAYSINACGDTLFSSGSVWFADKPQTPAPDAGPDIVVCNGEMGQLNGTVTSATNTIKWTYTGPGTIVFSPNNTSLNPQISMSTPGTYQLFLKETNDTCNLVGIDTMIVIYDEIYIQVSNDTIVCQNGTASLSASAQGYGNIDFHWNQTADLGPNQMVSPLTATGYTVYAESEKGCKSQTKTIQVDMYAPISAISSPSQTICPGDTVKIEAFPSGGIGAPYSYTWIDRNGNFVSNNNPIDVSPVETGNYSVTITDGCESSPFVSISEVIVGIIPEIKISVVDPAICQPAVFELYNETDATSLDETYWFISDGQSFMNNDNIDVKLVNAGYYDVTVKIVTHEGCTDSATVKNMLTVYPKPVADFTYYPNPVTNLDTKVHFQNGTKNGVSYEWFMDDASPNYSTDIDPEVQYPEYVVGDYYVQLIATSEHGCKDTIDGIVRIFPDVIIYAPNTFTPDGNEFNPVWNVYMDGVDINDITIEIYNRWGEQVWESHDLSIGWDGTYNHQLVKQGTYVWKIRAKNLVTDEIHEWVGHLNVLY
ncbi:MAG: choice-of-anchor L domain-containing protein [Brumimicrobium sp.]|nr:choice-of-anchor L domain-containing protein [Brumimicrobium sp.]MCO5267976.1 choice-of-anchor L domain-containing protein [Brumimicrobium sp.]